MIKRIALLGFCTAWLFLSGACLIPAAQEEGEDRLLVPADADSGKTKTQLLNELRLYKAEVELERRRQDLSNKRRELDIAKELFEERIYTLKEFNDAQRLYEEALVQYKQALLTLRETKLNFLKDATHISVLEAKKSILPDGRRMVDVRLKNTSNVSEAQTFLSGGTGDHPEVDTQIAGLGLLDQHMSKARLTSLLEIQNIIVSIYSAQGTAIIGKPYDQIVPSLKLHEERQLSFQLLVEAAEQIRIKMVYLDETETVPVVLEAESGKAVPVMEVMQFSQEADLGSSAKYSLNVERFSSGHAAFQLAVVNLPPQINYQFTDAKTNARLSQINFRQNETTHEISLDIYLPDRTDDDVRIDQAIRFHALVLTGKEWSLLQLGGQQRFPDAQLAKLSAGKVSLELVPRGVGKVEIRAINLYHEISTDEIVEMPVSVVNEGTRRLDNIQLRTILPLNWRSEIEPDVIGTLMPGKELVVTLRFLPPELLPVGDYEIQLRAEAVADNRPVETQDKTVRIHVGSTTNLLLSLFLVLGVIGIVIGIVWYGVRLTRR